MNRRLFVKNASATALASGLSSCASLDSSPPDSLIIDTHQHLWDRSQLDLPWLAGAPAVLRKDYRTEEYRAAFAGLNVKAIYMEVDVAPKHHEREADFVVGLCREGKKPTLAATIGGRPASAQFEDYITKYKATGFVIGVRQVLHGDSTPRGFCFQPDFVRGIRALGKHDLNFELTMRPTELLDGARLTEQCPETRFVLDHCGNGDPKAFNPRLAPNQKRSCTPDEWKRGIDALAARPNVVCKISGIVAFVPSGQWHADDLAPVVNHCLDAFGPDRVFFGGDWPVCLLGSSVRGWVEALNQIVSSRPVSEQRKLWSKNAIRFYRLSV